MLFVNENIPYFTIIIQIICLKEFFFFKGGVTAVTKVIYKGKQVFYIS